MNESTGAKKQMMYPSLKAVFQHLEANRRIQLVRRCPCLKPLDRATPLSLTHLHISASLITINDICYVLGVYRHGPNPLKSIQRNNEDGGIYCDLDEFGAEDLSWNRVMHPGNIYVEGAWPEEELTEEDQYFHIEALKERLAHLKTLRRMKERKEEMDQIQAEIATYELSRQNKRPDFINYVRLTVENEANLEEDQKIETMTYDKKLYEANAYLYEMFFGGRKHPIYTKDLTICMAGGVFRLPKGMVIKPRQISMGTNVGSVMKSIGPILIGQPESISIMDGLEGNLERNYQHPVIKSAKTFKIERIPLTGDRFHIIMESENQNLHTRNAKLTPGEFIRVIDKISADCSEKTWSFGVHNKKIIKELFKLLKERLDAQVERVQNSGCSRFPDTFYVPLDRSTGMSICCEKDVNFNEKDRDTEPWILWIQVKNHGFLF